MSHQQTQHFPSNTLPPVVKAFVEETARAMDAPIGYLGVAVLVALGAAIGNTRRIVLKSSLQKPRNDK